MNLNVPRQTIITLQKDDSIINLDRGIHSGSMKLSKSLTDSDNNDILLGGCIADYFELILEGIVDYTGYTINISQIIEDETINIFTGIIDICELQSDRQSMKLKAYDRFMQLGKLDVSAWYDGLEYPISIKDFFESLCAHINLDVVSDFEFTQNFTVYKTVSGTMSALTVLKAICEVCGGFGIINSDGLFNIVYLQNTSIDTLIPLSNFTLPETLVSAIDKVQIRSTKDDIGGIYGSGTNAYIVQGNFLCFDQTTEELQRIAHFIYDKISNCQWTPCELELQVSDPRLSTNGELYTITSPKGDRFNTYLFNIELSGTQLINEKVSSFGNEKEMKL